MTDYRVDDWSNTMTSLGSVRDKATGVTFSRRPRLSRDTLEAAYEQEPIVARVVDRLPDDALRNGWEITGLDVDVDMDYLRSKIEDAGINQALLQAAKWSRLYGGALLCLPTGGSSPDKPLNLTSIEGLYQPVVVSAYDARPVDMDATFGSPTFRKVLSYDIDNIDGSTIRIHHSRCIPFEPIQLPYEALLRSPTGWGPSVIDRIWDALSKEGAARAHAVSMTYISSLLYIQMDGFRAAHQTDKGREQIRDLLLNTRKGLDSLGILGLDKEDAIGNVSLSISGVTDVIDRTTSALAAAADMPKEILFNESPAGLNAGQLTGPQELWFAHVAAYQKTVLTNALNKMLEICFAAWGIPAREWTIEWNPLWVKSDADQAALQLQQAQADQIYFAMGAVSAEEVRAHRLEKGLGGALEVPDIAPEPLDVSVASYEEAENAEQEQQPQQASYEPPNGETPLSAGQLAEITGFSANSIRGMHKRGEIGGWRVGGRWRYLKSEILKSSHQPAASQAEEEV